MTSPLDLPPAATVRDLPGLEADNLLAFLALLGLLRALETAQPAWHPQVSWAGPPWKARLHLAEEADDAAIGRAAHDGIRKIAAAFDVDGRNNVDFDREGFRAYARRVRSDAAAAELAAALTAELPEKRSGGLPAAPLVMMFGQGHQNFLDRLVAVPSDIPPSRHARLKKPPNLQGPAKIEEALFAPWQRADDADAFRWDPEEDQRYALRHGDPSKEGAAPTVHGANRLAVIGFLSCSAAPGERNMTAVGAARDAEGWSFVWPIWSQPLSLAGIEALLAHPDLTDGRTAGLEQLGVVEVLGARRIANGKFMNVTRATPFEAAQS